MSHLRLLLTTVLLAVAGLCVAAPNTTGADARQLWQLLDYVAVDYAGAVADGKVVKAGEYAEMVEFAATAQRSIARLPAGPGHAQLVDGSAALVQAVARKADPAEVARLARGLADQVVVGYGIETGPRQVPDLARGATLYQGQCASCHGAQGNADGPAAARLDPPAIAFTDAARARERSVFGLYQVITQGVAGTSMASFAGLPEADRWALAFHVAGLSYDDRVRAAGQALWTTGAPPSAQVPDLDALARLTEADLAAGSNAAVARALMAYLRSHPQQLVDSANAVAAVAGASGPGGGAGLAIAREKLDQSVAAYGRGDAAGARTLALSAYLDGFEMVEPTLAARDPKLMAQVEAAMGEYRSRLAAGAPQAEVAAQAQVLHGLLDSSAATMEQTSGDASVAFFGSYTILVREGLEALLILIAMIAFLRKAERRDALTYVHAGWIVALVAGVGTWFAATYFVEISGASRELTEGLSALFAAAVLLSVGIWMHQKSVAGHWQHYLQSQLSAALTGRSAWLLFGLAFIAVYREVFETILFYIALWNQGHNGALLLGLLAGAGTLALIAVLMLRYSRRLPIGKFFTWSSVLITVLAVVLAGKGVAALQEAGWLSVHTLRAPRIPLLGMYPSMQSMLAQLGVLAVAVAGFVLNMRSGRNRPVARTGP
ncbi:cytochrome c/FTR1 family iron permease [Luteimonas sp. 50]|uniref:Cytochrome c/FTR1 family iron permease n=1 Tax=Cognatiluteimonas sedimenti TaxID=2927791 RepID=A0ABT0A0I7_9GAMM|nr:cytochrome c/FTR1 family iron permease [Lysobacter sedimenti]MCJ0824482.1 cytochrome c/FTR1 family iron permease [Lysobacter sedimenti]